MPQPQKQTIDARRVGLPAGTVTFDAQVFEAPPEYIDEDGNPIGGQVIHAAPVEIHEDGTPVGDSAGADVGAPSAPDARVEIGEPVVVQDDTPPTPAEEQSFTDKIMRDVLHGGRVMAGGLLDLPVLPSKLIAPVIKAFTGDETLTRANEQWDKMRAGVSGKDDDEYNWVENALHFGGQLVPTPGLVASGARGAVGIGQRALEAATALIPAKGLTLPIMGANVALPTGVVEGVKALKDDTPKTIEPPKELPRTPTVDKETWLQENREALLAAPIALMARGKYRKALGIKGKTPSTDIGAVRKMETAIVDSNAPLKQFLSPEQVTRVESTMPSSAMASRIAHAGKTGRMPSSDVRLSHIPGGMLQAWAKMPDDVRKITNIALRAADDLDNRALGGASVFPQHTDTQLRGMIATARANPIASRWMDAHKQTMSDILRYMRERGLLTQEKHTELLQTQSNYVSRITALMRDKSLSGIPRRIVEALLSSEKELDSGLNTIGQIMHRSGASDQTYETLVDAGTALEQVLTNTIRLAETNSVKRMSLRALSHQRDSKGAPLATRVAKVEDANMTVLVDGKRQYWNVPNPTLAHVLEFAPQYTNMLANQTRHIYQMMTTGPGGDALSMVFTGLPLQSIANASYEAFGILGQAYNKSKFNPVDAILALPTGLAMAAKARILELMARNAEESLLLGSPSARGLTQQSVRDAADAYARTIVGTLERHGGVLTGTTTHREFDTMQTLASQYAPTFYRQINGNFVPAPVRALWSQWMWTHDSVQLAWKYHYAMRNMPVNASAADEQRIANQVARVTGDFRQKGEPNKVLSLVRDSMPYSNVALQSMYAFGRGFKNNPTRMTTFLSGLALAEFGMIVWQMSENPDVAHYYWNVLTPEQRAQGPALFQDPSNPSAVQFITLPHESRPYAAAAREAFGTAMGFKDGSIYQNPDRLRALSEAFDKPWTRDDTTELRSGVTGAVQQIVGNAPIGGGVPAGLLGAAGYRWSIDRGIAPSPESKQNIEPGKEFSNDPHSAWVYNIVRNAAGMAGELAVQVDRGFNAVTDEASMFDRAKNAYAHGQEVYKQRAQRLTGLFGADHRITTMTTTFKHLQPKSEKIEMLPKVAAEMAAGGMRTNADARTGKTRDVPHDPKFSQEAITAMQAIPPVIMKQWNDTKSSRAQYYKMRDDIQNDTITPQEKTRLTNEYNRVINSHNAQLLLIAEDMERMVSKRLGKPFRFDDLRLHRE